MRPYGLVSSCAVLSCWFAVPLAAQRAEPASDTIPLSLPEAIERATTEGEEIGISRAEVRTAETGVRAARAQLFPQLSGSLGYVRNLETPYSAGSRAFELPDSLEFDPDTTAPLEERVSYLEEHAPGAGLQTIITTFEQLPIGQEHVYSAGLNATQVLFAGGGVRAGIRFAQRAREAAELGLAEQRADLALQVTGAYYQALLSQELETIAAAALEQADRFLADQRLRLEAGRASELDVLQAQVARDNLEPQLVRARNGARLAQLNLKRLVNLPLERPIRLETPLAVPSASELADTTLAPALRQAQQAALAAAEQQVAMRRQQVAIARSAFWPSVALQSSYSRQVSPAGMFDFGTAIPQNSWNVSLGVQIPVFQGLSRVADLDAAQLALEQSQLRLAQLRELVRLRYEQARGEKEEARSAIAARQRTVTTAERVYELVVLRFERGLATQLEVSEARLDLLEARTNLAQAIADFYTAENTTADGVSVPTGGTIPTTSTGAASMQGTSAAGAGGSQSSGGLQ